jgi:hypothetical protein
MTAALVLRDTLNALQGSFLHRLDQTGALIIAFHILQARESHNLINRWIGQTRFIPVRAERFQFINVHDVNIESIGMPGFALEIGKRLDRNALLLPKRIQEDSDLPHIIDGFEYGTGALLEGGSHIHGDGVLRGAISCIHAERLSGAFRRHSIFEVKRLKGLCPVEE